MTCCNIFKLFGLVQLCPTHGPRAACCRFEGFVLPSLGVRCSKRILHTDKLYLFW